MKKSLFSILCILLLTSSHVFAQPLCLSWSNVAASRSGCTVNVSWNYQQCIAGVFYVQYSTNASSFTTIGSRTSTGTVPSTQSYNFLDNYACPGVAGVNQVYYRILFVDIDGNMKTNSPILSVNMTGCSCSNNNTNRCTSITTPSITINGPDAICYNSSQTYTVAGASGNYSISWSLTAPSGSTATLTTNGNTATLSQGNSSGGSLTLNAYLTPLNQCTTSASAPAFTVRVGAPPYTTYSTLTTGGSTNELASCNTLLTFDYFYYGEVDVYDPQSTNFSWTRYSNGPVVSSMSANSNKPGPGHWIVDLKPTNNTVTWVLTRSNACGSVTNSYNFVTPGTICIGTEERTSQTQNTPLSLSITPNPAISTVLIKLMTPTKEIDKNTLKQTNAAIQQIKVANKMGAIKKLIKGNNRTDMSIDLSDLSPDVYTVSVFDGTDWLSGKIVKQ